MGLLEDALHASGGLHLWRQTQRFTAHVSIGGALCTRKCSSARLKELLVEGSTRDQVLEITGFMAADRRAFQKIRSPRPNTRTTAALTAQRTTLVR